MKILVFVDLHGNKSSLMDIINRSKKKDISLVVCVGDFTIFGEQQDLFLAKLDKIGKPVLMIHGNHEDASKKVKVDLEISADRVSISVQDEGEGFDPESLPDPVSADNLMREVGRGLFIVRAYMDEVHIKKIDGGGLRITLVKMLPAT